MTRAVAKDAKLLPLVDEGRLWRDIMAMAEITDPGHQYTRRSFSAHYLEGRKWVRDRLVNAGMAVKIDAAGNMIGRLEGAEAWRPPIVVGSHTDTVPGGGRFDGILGVMAGIEVVRALAGSKLKHPIEIVDFLAEEPSEFGLSCVGSRGMAGCLSPEMLLLSSPNGEELRSGIARFGGDPGKLTGPLRKNIAAFLELHIEQGRLLEEARTPVGVVTSIVGIVRVELVFAGAPDHSGTTPFSQRHDALVAAADTIKIVRELGVSLLADGKGYVVSTVGRVEVSPNAANVVPGVARLIVEVRAEDTHQLDQFISRLDEHSAKAAKSADVDRSAFRTLSRSEPTLCSPILRKHLAEAAADLGIRCKDLASGAGHDAAFMGQICPTAMIFVPSMDGRSHCPEEWTSAAECAAGATVLLETVMRIDADPQF